MTETDNHFTEVRAALEVAERAGLVARQAITALDQVRAAALEEAARVAWKYDGRGIDEDDAALTCEEIAAAIRALKERPCGEPASKD